MLTKLKFTTMKILVLLFASFFGFGLAVNETVRMDKTTRVVLVEAAATAPELEQPVMDVLLDTVEITVTAPVAVAIR
jgi:hypothetical protein